MSQGLPQAEVDCVSNDEPNRDIGRLKPLKLFFQLSHVQCQEHLKPKASVPCLLVVILSLYILCLFPPNTLISVALWRNIIRGGCGFLSSLSTKENHMYLYKYTEKLQGQEGLKLLGLCWI